MSETIRLPNHLRPRREKVFGPARGISLARPQREDPYHRLREGVERQARAARSAQRPPHSRHSRGA